MLVVAWPRASIQSRERVCVGVCVCVRVAETVGDPATTYNARGERWACLRLTYVARWSRWHWRGSRPRQAGDPWYSRCRRVPGSGRRDAEMGMFRRCETDVGRAV
nr:hypothetical protein CFP56_29970 [Quercus suber]